MKTWVSIGIVLASALPAWAGDKEDLAAAIRKLREAKGYSFKWNGLIQGQQQDGDGEFEKPGLWTLRHPVFEYIQAGDKARAKVPQQTQQRWIDPTQGATFFWYQYNMFLYSADLLLESAAKADKVAAGAKAAVGGVECQTLKTDVAGKDLRAAVGKFMVQSTKAQWTNYDQYYDWDQSSGSITIAIDTKTGWIRRISLDFSMQMKQNNQAQPYTAEFTLDEFDSARVKVPKALKKELGLGEG